MGELFLRLLRVLWDAKITGEEHVELLLIVLEAIAQSKHKEIPQGELQQCAKTLVRLLGKE